MSKELSTPTHLLKLMDPKDTLGISAVRSHLLPEAGGKPRILDGQRLLADPLVTVKSSDRLLGGGDQVLLLHGLVVLTLAALTGHLHGSDESKLEEVDQFLDSPHSA